MDLQDALQYLKRSLTGVYETRETATISDWVLEKITGLPKIDRIVKMDLELTPAQETELIKYTAELVAHRPVQYVLEEAYFQGLKFYVNESVLIPRPETEELVEWILADFRALQAASREISVLDIGTGSGCIAVSLKAKNSFLQISACDVSSTALAIAKKNADNNKAAIQLFNCDILNQSSWNELPVFDLIVSNPPYIPERDKQSMDKNVLNYEPHIALFTSDDDPNIFYRTIALFGKTHLKAGGKLYFEIHMEGAPAVNEILQVFGYTEIEIRNDFFGKQRMVSARV